MFTFDRVGNLVFWLKSCVPFSPLAALLSHLQLEMTTRSQGAPARLLMNQEDLWTDHRRGMTFIGSGRQASENITFRSFKRWPVSLTLVPFGFGRRLASRAW